MSNYTNREKVHKENENLKDFVEKEGVTSAIATGGWKGVG